MKTFYRLFSIIIILFSTNQLNSQTVWTGPTTTFSKLNNASWNLQTNQDRITNNVWLTRQSSKGLYNIKIEGTGDPCTNGVPGDTEWALGTTANYATLTYKTMGNLFSCKLKNKLPGKNMVLHLIKDDIYIDIKFISWTSGNGGGFSYQRSTDQTLNTNEFELDNTIKLSPNPSSDFLFVSGLNETKHYTIYNILGRKISTGINSKNEKIEIKNLVNGLYFLKFEDANTLKFIKE